MTDPMPMPMPDPSEPQSATPPAANPTLDPAIADIARTLLMSESLDVFADETAHPGNISVSELQAAFVQVFAAGVRAGIAQELGIEHVVHWPALTRFPWQVHGRDQRCDLFSEDLSNHTRIRAAFSPQDDRPHEVPLGKVPAEVLDAVRAAQSKERGR